MRLRRVIAGRFNRCVAAALALSLVASGPVQAGDLLRSGYVAPVPASSTSSSGSAAAPTVSTAGHANAVDTLARATQALQAVQAMQVAARALAASGANNLGLDPNHPGQQLPDVPNGLVAGGLQVKDGAAWTGASAPVAGNDGGKTTVTVTLNAQQALLTWSSFNVGKDTTLAFDQSRGGADVTTWIAFNKVDDPTGVPSQILGAITAPGQVYVINQNGIIFGGTAQVNAHTFVASSLPINDNLVDRGLLNNPDNQFLFSSLPIAAGANGMPAFTPSAANTPDGHAGDVVVQAGAQLTSPTNDAHVGGRIALFGPNVANSGTIATPDGQAILAAGQQIGLAAHDSNDPTLRGLDVFVGAGGGTVTNEAGARIDAPRASVILAGKAVDQLGAITSTTSVAYNGRIDLLADYDAISSGGYSGLPAFFPVSTGTVAFGADSVTQILPEWNSTERIVGSQLALSSQVNVRGLSVYFAPQSVLLAPSAGLTIDAGRWNLTGAGATAQDLFAYTSGEIYLDQGAAIDVSGSANVAASVQENIVDVELRGSELANSPLQRDGALRGQTVQIDIRQTGTYNGQAWVGTPLANTTGYVALVDHTVGELTTTGGSVKLNAGGAVVMQPGSAVNVSGGWINYTGGVVRTTKVIADGRLIDIAQATPDRVYDGIYTGTSTTSSAKWGTTDATTNPQLDGAFEAGYVQGGGGGSLAITAPAMALDGNLFGSTVAGARQRTAPPAPSALELAFAGQDPALPQNFYPTYSPTPPAITFQDGVSLAAVGAYAAEGTTLPDERKEKVALSPSLLGADAFGSITIDNSDGDITVPAAVTLAAPALGALKFTAANIDIEGRLSAPGGSLSFTTYDRSPYADRALTGGATPPPPEPDLTRGVFTLGSGARLDASGSIVDERSGVSDLALVTTGGAVTITSYTAKLAAGGVIDVAGGVAVSSAGKASYGSGGAIAIKAGQDPAIGSLLGGTLTLGATLSGYSGAKGGSLAVLAPFVQVGGTTSDSDTLLLAPDFFNAGGFTNFSISGIGAKTSQAGSYRPGLVIAPGTVIAPAAESWLFQPDAAADAILGTTLQPAGVRTPVSLTFGAPGARDPFNPGNPIAVRGDLVMGAGAVIRTDPKGSVTLSGDTVLVQGSVIAPGGAINVSGAKDSTLMFADPGHAQVTVDLAPGSLLSTAGTTVLTPDPRGLRAGSVLAGGTISVGGNIAAESGATLDVSGATGTLDLAPSYSQFASGGNASTSGLLTVATRIDSNGGSITLAGGQELFVDATLRGAAGGATATGGKLTLSSGRFYPPGTSASAQTPLNVNLTLTQSEATIPAQTVAAGQSLVGATLKDPSGALLAGAGYFAADTFNASGLASLALKGTVSFSGAVSLSAPASLTVATNGVLLADGAVTLDAPYVALGSAFVTPLLAQEVEPAFLVQGQPFYAPATHGTGSLAVHADLIDVGNLSLRNIGSATLAAADGDIRGDGTLEIAGALTLRAGQIYPPTDVSFTIAAFDTPTTAGSVTIEGGSDRQTPLSAGGALNIYGSTIVQGGTLRAPIGTINLGWDGTGAAPKSLVSNQAFLPTQQLTLAPGSVTSVSAVDATTGDGLVIPYGSNLNGTSWIDPASNDITVGGVPGKAVHVSAVNVQDQSGASIDVSGGGDLYAYRWVSGVGGTKDILASTTSFAVIPDYAANYAPFAPFNPTTLNTNLNGDAGYVNAGLAVGDRVYLDASSGLPAGVYTLLPARYALLPGAFLLTPKPGTPPTAAAVQPDGASIVAGYRYNDLDATRTGAPLAAAFEVASQKVVHARAQYDDFSGNAFLAASAPAHDAEVPRLPVDAGQLVFDATAGMVLQGSVAAAAPQGGRGGLVDISSPVDIYIGADNAAAPAGTLALNAGELNDFGAQSLLIGGVRTTTTDGEVVTVKTNNLTLDNAGTPLTGADVVLAANQTLTLAPGAAITQDGAAATGAVETITIGDADQPGSGDGALVRVSSDAAAQVKRAGVDAAAPPTLVVAAGVQLQGASVTLDSTHTTTLDPSATLDADALALGSGQITLNLSGAAATGGGLVLSGEALQALENTQSLSLLSYSTIDILGAGVIGGGAERGDLALHAGAIRGFDPTGGTVTFAADTLLLDNAANVAKPAASSGSAGTLVLDANTVQLGANALGIEHFATTRIAAAGGIIATATGGLAADGALQLNTPVIAGATGATEGITAGGALTITHSGAATVSSGLGAYLTLTGQSVTANSDILLPSGSLTLRATSGDLSVGSGSRLDVSGTAKTFYDLTKFTNGGALALSADHGAVNLAAGSVLAAAAPAGGGDAGTLSVSAPGGTFTAAGAMTGGEFSLDVGQLAGGSLGALNTQLNAGGFADARSFRVRTGDVAIDARATAHTFDASADAGSLTVTGSGVIDASGATGGAISLAALGGITLEPGALLTVAGEDFDAAGKGGTVDLETRGATGATVNVAAGSTIDLSVASRTADSASRGEFEGTLHLRAPQTSDGTDLQVAPIAGTLRGGAGVVVEGFHIFDLTAFPSATITSGVEASVMENGTTFAGHAAAIGARLAGGDAALASLLHVRPGAEIVNRSGDLTLASAWDLSTFRFGPDHAEPGVLTLRAAGNLIFDYSYNSVTRVATVGTLSDGFGGSSTYGLWDAPLLPAGSQSWSYRLVAGADFAGADDRDVQALTSIGSASGSLLLGRNAPPVPLPSSPNAPTDTRQSMVPRFYQTIRTGTGDIDIHAARDVQLLNPLATIYTAGTQAPALANFDTPNLAEPIRNSKLGTTQSPIYPAQFSLAGGNITITAQRDIARYVLKDGELVADSSLELPTNWLYRQGHIDAATGQFGATHDGGAVASTAWWVDFSNFFADVGALGGGNVTLQAGHTIANVDAATVTNARMPKGTPDAAQLVELGGGDLVVRAGGDIDGGVYYVERGQGTLAAGGSIHSNGTRAALTQADAIAFSNAGLTPDASTWLPTTLFVGDASFDVQGRGDVLLGPVANPFLAPQGVNNNAYEKSYFSTYTADSGVDVSSLTGTLTLRDSSDTRAGSLADWYANVLLYDSAHHRTFASYSEPWLRVAETDVTPFFTALGLMPGTLRATAFAGALDLVGRLTLSPAARGTLDLVAAGAVNGVQVNGINNTSQNHVWASSVVNLSDADPRRVPGILSPVGLAPAAAAAPTVTPIDLLDNFNLLFNESGSTSGLYGVVQTKQALHAAGPLHLNDPTPAHLYSEAGSISGLTLFSAKATRVVAGNDITDVSLYLQNTKADDVSVVAAGRDLLLFDANSPLRLAAQTAGNELLLTGTITPQPGTGNATAGDVQISGPGTLEVLAGRNLDLGISPAAGDGTAVGVTSIGNARNPNLGFAGADIVAAAGIGPAANLDASALDFSAFEKKFLDPASAGADATRYLDAVRADLGMKGASNADAFAAYEALTVERRHAVALDVFYRVLRNAGRDHGDPDSAGFRNYDAGFAAITTLFPGESWDGSFSLTSREIKTANGGDIRMFAPGGELVVGFDVAGGQAVDQGILTESGGNISIFTHDNVTVGVSRIFTLRGGNEIIWSSAGNIAAGASSKTVQSAPPTRVLVDPQSGDVKTDLAGLATGGGIGVLATVAGVPPGDVDLIAPVGTIDAGDAGIRVSGNLNVSALQVVNSANIQVSGSSVGTPVVAAPNIGGLVAAASTTAAAASAASDVAKQNQQAAQPAQLPSIITVEVLGYGGGDGGGMTSSASSPRRDGAGAAGETGSPRALTAGGLPELAAQG
ncbi:MAG TPA: filamentous hemagglutinin family protein [Opitutus sp.]|nr:filamentous hemagglutinin family protein [Opitutus sp.]